MVGGALCIFYWLARHAPFAGLDVAAAAGLKAVQGEGGGGGGGGEHQCMGGRECLGQAHKAFVGFVVIVMGSFMTLVDRSARVSATLLFNISSHKYIPTFAYSLVGFVGIFTGGIMTLMVV